MKFDFVIGNPPYHEEVEGNDKGKPLYNYFYDEAEKIADCYEFISPGRFLFNAGMTSKKWNEKMLNDKHFKVLQYMSDSKEAFPNTDIKGGVAITFRNANEEYQAIEEFIVDENLRNIVQKVKSNDSESISNYMYGGRADLKFNDYFLNKFPNYVSDRIKATQVKHPTVTSLPPGEEYEIRNRIFEDAPYIFSSDFPAEEKEEYYKILGLYKSNREYRWIKKEYLIIRYPENNNIFDYKVYISKASGTGAFGEKIGEPVIGYPGEFSTPTFIGIGKFNKKIEAINASKYLKTRFVRALLSVLKITQDIVPTKFKYVPMQDFSDNSDINWNVSISDIDNQLYKKYDLSENEIVFLLNNVKEME
ncbi:MAG: Eco57I restriction-modification methylase domain-containing protein [Eubacterium sp.]|nr:Eco57I restriction-modification methylase domain-containing protein [Eubacterium sp.]